MSDSFVYAICKDDCGVLTAPVKVGITTNIKSRLKTLGTYCPFKIGICSAVKTPSHAIARELEDDFHQTFQHVHAHGEWFDMEPDEAAKQLDGLWRQYLFCKGYKEDTEAFKKLWHRSVIWGPEPE